MTAGVCSICSGSVGVHDAEKHRAWNGRNGVDATRPLDISRAEIGRLIRENARLRAQVAKLKLEGTP